MNIMHFTCCASPMKISSKCRAKGQKISEGNCGVFDPPTHCLDLDLNGQKNFEILTSLIEVESPNLKNVNHDEHNALYMLRQSHENLVKMPR